LSNEELGFKIVTYRAQQRHHKKDIELQLQKNASPTLNLQDEVQFPEQTSK